MTKTFTQNDVIRYIYNEMNESEKTGFLKAVDEDEQLMSLFLDCKNQIKDIDEKLLNPPAVIVEQVIDYSANYNPQG